MIDNAFPMRMEKIRMYLERIESLPENAWLSLAAIALQTRFLDADFYLREYVDVEASDIDPALHYVRCGFREARRPGAWADGRDLEKFVAQQMSIEHMAMKAFLRKWLDWEDAPETPLEQSASSNLFLWPNNHIWQINPTFGEGGK